MFFVGGVVGRSWGGRGEVIERSWKVHGELVRGSWGGPWGVLNTSPRVGCFVGCFFLRVFDLCITSISALAISFTFND